MIRIIVTLHYVTKMNAVVSAHSNCTAIV